MLLGIDANNWIAQIWHVNIDANVIELALTRLKAVMAFVKPTATYLCFDDHSFRYNLWPEYKAHRATKPDSLLRAIRDAPESFAKIANVHIIKRPQMEADDCLASLAIQGRRNAQRVVLSSGDKDLRQCLLDGCVTQLRKFDTQHGVFCNPVWYNAAKLLTDMGLRPYQWPSYQALCGDSGDGIPGCSGWGEKTTLTALHKFPTLQECLEHIGEAPVSDRLRANLALFAPQADLMLQLVTLRTDLEIE